MFLASKDNLFDVYLYFKQEARKELSTTDEYQKFTFDVSALHEEIENCYKKEHALLIAFREEKRRRKEIERKLDVFKTEVKYIFVT